MKLKKDYLFLVSLTILLIFVFPMTVGASNQPALDVYEEWKSTGEMTDYMAQVINENENIDQLMEEKLGEIKELIKDEEPDFAFVKMLQLTSFLNAGAAKLPSIIDKLKEWIKKIIFVLNSLAKEMKADGFSISAGFPIGVSIGLSFPIF